VSAVSAGVPVIVASGVSGVGLDDLRGLVREHGTMALLGASGVGKSTLINALVGGTALRTSKVREATSAGDTPPPPSSWSRSRSRSHRRTGDSMRG
jgi:ribosome biogenesis GTPase